MLQLDHSRHVGVWITALVILLSITKHGHTHEVHARSGPGVAEQTCETSNFFCPYDTQRDQQCSRPRSERCSSSSTCVNPTTMMEEGCQKTSTPGLYKVQLGHARLSSFSSSKKRSCSWNIFRLIGTPVEHQFITFRGFTYEFGSSYGVQVLDIADPLYKYANGAELNSNGIENIGSSYCTMDDANMVVNMWKNEEYCLINSNCQHFAKAMSHVLLNSPCNQPSANGQLKKRQDNNQELVDFIDTTLRDCNIICCNTTTTNNSGSNAAPSHAGIILLMCSINIVSSVFIMTL